MKTLPILFTALLGTPAGAFAFAPPQEQAQPASGSSEEPVLDVLVRGFADWKLKAGTGVPDREALGLLERLQSDAGKLAMARQKDPEVLALYADVHARVLIELQRTGDSEALANELMKLRLTAFESTEVTPIREVARGVLRRPDVVALAAALPVAEKLASLPEGPQVGEGEVIARAVREAIERGDPVFLDSLGSRALPELERLALQIDGSPLPEGKLNPLQIIKNIDSVKALDTATELVGQRGTVLVKQAVVGALGNVLADDSVWQPIGESGWGFTHPEWDGLFNELVSEPTLDESQWSGFLGYMIERGVVPSGLMPAALRRGPGNPGHGAVIAPGRKELAIRSVASESEKVRIAAIRVLRSSGDLRAALGLSSDASKNVREELAEALSPVWVSKWTGPLRESKEQIRVAFAGEDTGYQRALVDLLGDSHEEVFRESANSHQRLVDHVFGPVLSFDQRTGLLAITTSERLEDLFGVLARQAPREEFEALALLAFERMPVLGMSEAEQSEFFWSVLNAVGEDSSLRWRLFEALPALEIPEENFSASLAFHADEDAGSLPVADRYLGVLEGLNSGAAWFDAVKPARERRNWPLEGWRNRLSDEQIVRLWKGVSKHASEMDWGSVLGQPVAAPLSAQLIASPDIAPEIKLRFLTQVRDGWGVHLTTPVLQALAEAARATFDSSSFYSAFDGLPEARFQDFLLTVLKTPDTLIAGGFSEPAVPDQWLLALNVPNMEDDVLQAVLARFPANRFGLEEFSEGLQPQLLRSAVDAMVRSGRPQYLPAIQAAAASPELQVALVNAIGEYRSEDLFGLLTELVSGSVGGSPLWHSGLSSVASFLNDEAMEFLLSHAREVSTASSRERVMTYLEEIRRWQEAAEQWERSRSSRDQRRDAIAELVALAEDAAADLSVRAEALRGLGLLNATEELPRLVRALTAPEEQLRKAAREAIDRLHAKADSGE